MPCSSSEMASCCYDEFASLVDHQIAVTHAQRDRRDSSSAFSEISLLSTGFGNEISDPRSFANAAEVNGRSAWVPAPSYPCALITQLIPEILSRLDNNDGRSGIISSELDLYRSTIHGWTSNLTSMERYLRDLQRHEQLALSLVDGYPCGPPLSPGTEPRTMARKFSILTHSTKSKIPPLAEDNVYCESYYDPYDQPPATQDQDIMTKPAVEISFERYRELMREYFAVPECTPPTPENPDTEGPVPGPRQAPELPPDPPSEHLPPPAEDTPQPTAPWPKPVRQANTQQDLGKTTRPPICVASIPGLKLDPGVAENAQDDDDSLRAVSQLVHQRLVLPVPSSASQPTTLVASDTDGEHLTTSNEMYSEAAMLRSRYSRFEESRTSNNRTFRHALVRKRKREEAHPAPRANRAVPGTVPNL